MNRILRTIPVPALALALLVSGYLVFRSLALLEGARMAPDVCSALFSQGCDATLSHSFSRQLGIPVAGWGVIYFATLLALLALGRLLDPGFRAAASSAAALVACAGGAASIALILSQVSGVVPLCPLCLVANGLNLLAVAPLATGGGRSLGAHLKAWGRGLSYLTGREVADACAARYRVLSFAFVGLFAGVLYQWVVIEADRAESASRTPSAEDVVADYEAAPVVDLPIDTADPILGPTGARARLVVFSDAFCPFCRGFWSGIRKFTAKYGEDLQVVYKHFPLDSPCNAAVPASVHPLACNAGLALEAANAQGQFWAYHDALSTPRSTGKENPLIFAARNLGLDMDRFTAGLKAPGTKERLEGDVALGVRLGVTTTPALFLNGRRLASANPRALEYALDHALGRR
jgi:protein-disulfide isomerase/uncharacterized membrane protein